MTGETIIVYDDDLVDRAAWKLAVADGYTPSRCGSVAGYHRRIETVIQALDAAAQERADEAGE